jgi:hypothetical protein
MINARIHPDSTLESGIFFGGYLNKRRIDLPDIFTLSGLGCLGYGLWMFRPWISLTVVGSLLVLLGAIGAIGQARGK